MGGAWIAISLQKIFDVLLIFNRGGKGLKAAFFDVFLKTDQAGNGKWHNFRL